MRVRMVAALLVGAACLVLIAVALHGPARLTLHMSQTALQQRIDAALPLHHRSGSLLEVTVDVATATLDLPQPADPLTSCQRHEPVHHHALDGAATVSGSLRADAAACAFFLDDAQILLLRIDHGDRSFTDHHGWLGRLLCQLMEVRPIFVITPTSLPRDAARLVLKAVRVESGELILELGI